MGDNMKVVEIALDDIEVGARLRMPDLVAVEGLAASIEAHGLMSPIEVVKISYQGLNKLAGDGTYQLVCGGHRYAAFRMLGRDVIPAFVVKGSKDQLRMREILENVSRSELTKLERVVFTAELREVVERVYGDEIAAHGGDRKSDENQVRKLRTWSDLVAERTGWSKDTTRRAWSIGEKINPELAAKLAGSVIADNQRALEDLVKLALSNGLAFKVIDQLNSGEAKTVKAAHLVVSGKADTMPAEISAQDKVLLKLQSAWGKADQKTKNAFLIIIEDEIDG